MNFSPILLFSLLQYLPNARGQADGPRDEAMVYCGGGSGKCKKSKQPVDKLKADRNEDEYGVRCCRDDVWGEISRPPPSVDQVPGKWPQKCGDQKGVGKVEAESRIWNITDSRFPDQAEQLEIQCWKKMTFYAAWATCRSAGARLCNEAELLDGCAKGTGCGLNKRYVWGCKEPWSPFVDPPAWDNTCETNAECCYGVCEKGRCEL